MTKKQNKRKMGRPRKDAPTKIISIRMPLALFVPVRSKLAQMSGMNFKDVLEIGLDSILPGWRASAKPDKRQADFFR